MILQPEAKYRYRLAQGFLDEARQDQELKRWRSCVDNSQLAVENAAKAILALLAPLGRTHDPATLLRQALSTNRFAGMDPEAIERLAECAELMGRDIHIRSDYGDEAGWQTPWDLFDAADAEEALNIAENAVHLAKQLLPNSEEV
jgi:HEPN domain-containing protein